MSDNLTECYLSNVPFVVEARDVLAMTVVGNSGWKQAMIEMVTQRGGLPSDVPKLMTSVEFAGKGMVGKPVTTVSLGFEVNV